MASEQVIQSKLLKFLKSKGFYAFKVIAANKSGIPDVIACCDGKFVAFECKSSVGKLSKLQEYNIKLIKESEGICFVISPDNFETFKLNYKSFLYKIKEK